MDGFGSEAILMAPLIPDPPPSFMGLHIRSPSETDIREADVGGKEAAQRNQRRTEDKTEQRKAASMKGERGEKYRNAKMRIDEWTAGITARKFAEGKKLAPGYLDTGITMLTPERRYVPASNLTPHTAPPPPSYPLQTVGGGSGGGTLQEDRGGEEEEGDWRRVISHADELQAAFTTMHT